MRIFPAIFAAESPVPGQVGKRRAWSGDLPKWFDHCTLGPLSRFGQAILLALAIHGAWVVLLALRPPAAVMVQAGVGATELQVEYVGADRKRMVAVDRPDEAVERAVVESSAAKAPAAQTVNSPVSEVVASAAPTGLFPPTGIVTTEGESVAAVGIAQQPEPSVSLAPKIDLGLDGRLFQPRWSDLESKPSTRREAAAKVERQLNASLVEADVQRGLARGGALVGSLSSAVRTAGPAVGDAVVRVTLNSRGELGELELLRGSTSDWAAVLRVFREQAKRSAIRVPIGAQGLRVTFSVSAKLQRPSGARVGSSAIALNGPSLAPNGLVPGGSFDVADLSNKTSRVAYVRVLTEEVL